MTAKRLTPGVHGRYATRRGGKPPPAGESDLMTSEEFFDLLRRRTPENASEIDRAIEDRGVQEMTILASDSSGFSRKTHEYGILQFLAVMTRCYDELIPLIEERGGACLTHNADNILAVFKRPEDAVSAAVAMHRRLRRHNAGKAEREKFNICIGIHCGKAVRLKDNVFGDRVNVAAKLGEDIAGRDEIIVSAEVAGRVQGRFECVYSKSVEIGGRGIELYRVVY